MSTANQGASIPVEVRRAVREWVIGTYGLDNPGVPIQLIERVDLEGQTVYRLEADVKDITISPHRMPVYLAVVTRPDAQFEIDLDTVVFFDEGEDE